MRSSDPKPLWRLDAETGIPYPSFHDLQEPVTPVTRMKIQGDYLYFSTGKNLYANNGIVGLSPEGEAFGGSDGSIELYQQPLAKEERIELADYMIEQWTVYKKRENQAERSCR